MACHLIIVARERPDLLALLAVTYGQKGAAEIRVDRRQDHSAAAPWAGPERRARPTGGTELQASGFLVIPRPELVDAFC